jgi:hypothetical protein
MGNLKIRNKKEHFLKIKNHLQEARNMLIELCNETNFPSKEYDYSLSIKDGIDFLLHRLEPLGYIESLDKNKIDGNETKA